MKFKLYVDDLETHIRFKRQIGLAPQEKVKTNLFYKKDSVFIVYFEITDFARKIYRLRRKYKFIIINYLLNFNCALN